MPDPIDLTDYVSAPYLSVPTAVALGIALLSAVPESPTEVVLLSAGRLREAVVELQQQWGRKVAAGLVVPTTPREADVRVDRSFRAMSMQLEALTLLRPEAGPQVELARTVHARLFPDGLRFLTLPFDQQWAHGKQILDLIDSDAALEADVGQLVNAIILTELHDAQQAYGEVQGITAPREDAESVSLTEPLDTVRKAIIGYALQVVAMQDIDRDRIADARKALAPIDQLRARQARRATASDSGEQGAGEGEGEGEGEEVTPETPVPSVGEGTPTGG